MNCKVCMDAAETCTACGGRITRAALAAVTKERDALREVRQKGCACSDSDACRFARERDEAKAEVERLRFAKVEAEQEIHHLRGRLRSVAERQRTACAAFLRDNYYEVAASEAIGTDPMWCVAQTPLVTEEE